MNFEKAKPEDKKDILEISNLLYIESIPQFVWNTPEYITRQIESGEYFLAKDGQKTAGIISFRERWGKMYVETLAVTKEYQLNGIGALMLDFAKKIAKEKGFRTLNICSFYEYNALDFYLKNGFSLLRKPGKYNRHKFYRFEINLE